MRGVSQDLNVSLRILQHHPEDYLSWTRAQVLKTYSFIIGSPALFTIANLQPSSPARPHIS